MSFLEMWAALKVAGMVAKVVAVAAASAFVLWSLASDMRWRSRRESRPHSSQD